MLLIDPSYNGKIILLSIKKFYEPGFFAGRLSKFGSINKIENKLHFLALQQKNLQKVLLQL